MAATKRIVIQGRTSGQDDLLDAIQENTVTFAIGPAGTGKTHLSVASAVKAFKEKKVERIIITRPVVEAGGEKLGFLPGTLNEKMDPYLRPVLDSMRCYMSPEEIKGHIELGNIEIAPLAYMRGRTLKNSFIIFDEAQNANEAQIYMVLTRLGSGSKMVVNGDPTQTDLPGGIAKSGLYNIHSILGDNIQSVEFVYFDKADIVRHPTVKLIVERYEKLKTEQDSRIVGFDSVPYVVNGNSSSNGNHVML